MAPVAFMLGDDEWERRGKTDADVSHRRCAASMSCSCASRAITFACRSASARARHAVTGDVERASPRCSRESPTRRALAHLLDALTADRIVAETPVVTEEPERFRRLWGAIAAAVSSSTARRRRSSSSRRASTCRCARSVAMRRSCRRRSASAAAIATSLLVLRMRIAVLLLSAPRRVGRGCREGSSATAARSRWRARFATPSYRRRA